MCKDDVPGLVSVWFSSSTKSRYRSKSHSASISFSSCVKTELRSESDIKSESYGSRSYKKSLQSYLKLFKR